jgi:hypothetical protein
LQRLGQTPGLGHARLDHSRSVGMPLGRRHTLRGAPGSRFCPTAGCALPPALRRGSSAAEPASSPFKSPDLMPDSGQLKGEGRV